MLFVCTCPYPCGCVRMCTEGNWGNAAAMETTVWKTQVRINVPVCVLSLTRTASRPYNHCLSRRTLDACRVGCGSVTAWTPQAKPLSMRSAASSRNHRMSDRVFNRNRTCSDCSIKSSMQRFDPSSSKGGIERRRVGDVRGRVCTHHAV